MVCIPLNNGAAFTKSYFRFYLPSEFESTGVERRFYIVLKIKRLVKRLWIPMIRSFGRQRNIVYTYMYMSSCIYMYVFIKRIPRLDIVMRKFRHERKSPGVRERQRSWTSMRLRRRDIEWHIPRASEYTYTRVSEDRIAGDKGQAQGHRRRRWGRIIESALGSVAKEGGEQGGRAALRASH